MSRPARGRDGQEGGAVAALVNAQLGPPLVGKGERAGVVEQIERPSYAAQALGEAV
ncbi:MAG: hypothetical protein IH849_00920 [Acidobacteria bacterium]|nr:hypothetical protein [Acidobacteriota bacterium]